MNTRQAEMAEWVFLQKILLILQSRGVDITRVQLQASNEAPPLQRNLATATCIGGINENLRLLWKLSYTLKKTSQKMFDGAPEDAPSGYGDLWAHTSSRAKIHAIAHQELGDLCMDMFWEIVRDRFRYKINFQKRPRLIVTSDWLLYADSTNGESVSEHMQQVVNRIEYQLITATLSRPR